jgi:hypothetical protein
MHWLIPQQASITHQGQTVLIFNCTKAAAEFFSATRKGKKITPVEVAPEKIIPESNDGQWQWLVHVVNVRGKKVVVMMEHQTRFSITLSGLKKGNEADFLNAFELHLSVNMDIMMSAVNAESQAFEGSVERYREQHTSRAFYLRGDRSVQSHINDVVWHFRNAADSQGEVPAEADLIEFDIFSNELLRQRKAAKTYFYPQREFSHAWLRHYAQYSTTQADACIDHLKAKARADFAARHPALISPTEHTDASLSSGAPTVHRNNIIQLDAYRKK